MSDGRADRLRERRNDVSEKAKQSQPSESENTDKQSKQSEPSKRGEPSETEHTDESDKGSVKDERVGTYMYLPGSQKDRIKRLYNYLKADYEIEYDDDFEKNRHFYPLVAEFGLDRLDEMSPSDVRERLEENGWL